MADSEEQYKRDCEAVRAESKHLSDADYKEQRLKVDLFEYIYIDYLQILQLFLQVPNIFATKAFRDAYESRARQNIEREIKGLSS
jgi:predicted metal-dependent HD superfamily phosphohydrolase